MKKLLLLGAALLAVQALPALAEEGKGPKDGGKHLDRMFNDQDADKDGTISETEFTNFSKKKYAEMDSDKNGKLTREEIKSHHDAKRAEWKAKREQMKKDKEAATDKVE